MNRLILINNVFFDPGINNITASGVESSWTSPRSLPPWLPV